MVGFRSASSAQYAVEFATPVPPEAGAPPSVTGPRYTYETFMIRKKDMDPLLKLKIEYIAVRPGASESSASEGSSRTETLAPGR